MSITPDTEAFKKIVAQRHTTRAFLPTPVDSTIIRSVLDDGCHSPSNCNSQPWNIHILSGGKLAAFQKEVKQFYVDGKLASTGDFSFDQNAFQGRLHDNQKTQGRAMYALMDIPRDAPRESDIVAQNIDCYGAPHLMLLFFPETGDNVRMAADMGQYAQTIMLSLEAHGLASVPQTAYGLFGQQAREILQIEGNMKMLFGISFGYEDKDAKINTLRMPRDPIETTVTFHE